MKINIREQKTPSSSNTFISPNLIKESMRIDQFGNEIDPRTKQIIKRNNDK